LKEIRLDFIIPDVILKTIKSIISNRNFSISISEEKE